VDSHVGLLGLFGAAATYAGLEVERVPRIAGPPGTGSQLSSPGLQFRPRRHLRLRLSAADVDTVLVHVPAPVGEERVGVRGARPSVWIGQRIAQPQFSHVGRGGVREYPGVSPALRTPRLVQQTSDDLVPAVLGAFGWRARARVPDDRIGGRLGTGFARVGEPGL
jgi:hypothetical protein